MKSGLDKKKFRRPRQIGKMSSKRGIFRFKKHCKQLILRTIKKAKTTNFHMVSEAGKQVNSSRLRKNVNNRIEGTVKRKWKRKRKQLQNFGAKPVR